MIAVGDPLDATGHYGLACTGALDEKVSVNSKKLGARVAALVTKLKAYLTIILVLGDGESLVSRETLHVR
jgi:hypothetical protein